MQRSIVDEFSEQFVNATSKLIVGDPLDDKTQVGASVSKAHAEKVLAYIDCAIREVKLLLI